MHIKLKSQKTKLLRLLLIVLLLNLASVYFLTNSNIFVISPLDNNSNSINLPKTSDNEITIDTPENKTYTGPMIGYYPATYGFENDNFGEIPHNWNDLSGTGCSVEVVNEIYDHKKVIQLNDNSGNAAMVETFFPNQETGIVEWWWLSTDVDKWTNFVLYQGSTIAILLEIALSSFRYYAGSYNTVVSGILNNSWYKNKIDFDVSTDTFNWYIYYNNGSLLGSVLNADFQNSVNDINHLRTATNSGQSGFQTYIDAVGFSWDSNYNIGDNLKEGLLLSYENSTNLDWIGYSLDGGANKTIKGNITIPLPVDGQHDIQVFGNNSFGANFQSNIRYFSVYHLTINTPENKTYIEPMSGYYPGTYGFENDIINSFPYDWIDNDVATCETKVIGDKYGHKNVVQQYDDHGSAAAQMNKDIPATSIITVEFWVRTDLLTLLYFNVRDSSITYNTWDLRDLSGFSADTWHHVRFVINTVTDKYDSYLDGILKNNQDNLPSPMNDVDQIQFNTAPSQINYNVWWDAIGGNWDTNYNIGDNLKEGLLLSYENSTNLDWTGYSLDGGANKTIIGNTTIPLPIDGQHDIQVYGNNSFGADYHSKLRYFSVRRITINTPENKTYLEPMSGYYPGTFGFENDIVNSFPYDWIDNDVATCETKVIGDKYGHKNVVQQYDDHGSAAAQMNKDIPATSIITVEFWVRTDLLVLLYFNVQDSLSTSNSWDLRNLSGFSVDTWHHVRFVINTVTDKYDSYLDGVLKNNQDNLPSPMNEVDQIQFNTAPSQINYNVWWDAIGGNWDTNYNIGDNLKEGLLLSYENSTNLDWKGYSFDGQGNKTILGNTTISLPEDGYHNIQVFGNDSSGRSYKSKIQYFSVDTLGPSITINFPTLNHIFNSTSPDYDVMITDFNLDKMWYSLDKGSNNISFTELTGRINQNEWNKQVDGNVTLRFFANDTFGHVKYMDVLIEKDTTNPLIIINTPAPNNFYSLTPPDFSLTITELNLNTAWYTLDNGLTNVTFSGQTGTIDQTEWDKQSDGAVQIRFYANDSVGNKGYTDRLIYKDTINPIITINSPISGGEFYELPPEFNITVDELNLDSTWYSIDGGLTTFIITETTGFIDSTAWNEASIGAVTLRFYARDIAGNEIYQEVAVLKRTTEVPPEIPGFNLPILFIMLGLITIISIKIKKNKIK